MAQTIIFLHGGDSYSSWRQLKTIEARFLARDGAADDLIRFDLEETEPGAVVQALGTQPFFVSHRLCVVKNPFASRVAQETLLGALPLTTPSTVVVLFEPQAADGRTKLWQWLKAHAKVYTNEVPKAGLGEAIDSLAADVGVSVAPVAKRQLAAGVGSDSWRLATELAKLASYVLANGRTTIEPADMNVVGSLTPAVETFDLTNALRDGRLDRAIAALRRQTDVEPMASAGLIASFVRQLAKVVLAKPADSARQIAERSGVNPYVVSLLLPLARRLPPARTTDAYDHLLRFESEVKSGRLDAALALVLLVIRMSGTLKGSP